MADRLPWIKFWPADWTRDTRCLSAAGKGTWMDLICFLWDSPTRGKATMPLVAWARSVGQTEGEFAVNLAELQNRAILDLETMSNGDVTLLSRRVVREERERESTRLRVQRFRETDVKRKCNGRVTVQRLEARGKRTTTTGPSALLSGPTEVAQKPSSELTPEALVKLYNECTPTECSMVTKLSPARLKKAKQYLAMFPKREFWETSFRNICESEFLRGLKPSNGHQGFKADFDWLLSKNKDGTENVVKVYEGRYK